MKRGEIWWAELLHAGGSEPAFRRPVLIVQTDAFNRSRIGTIVVAAITSNLRLADAPGNVKLTTAQSGLPKPSVVNVSQILTVDRVVLTKRVARVPAARMRTIEAGLRLVLGV